MSVISVKGVDQKLFITDAPAIASGGVNEDYVKFQLDSHWDGFTLTAIYYVDENNVYKTLVDDDGLSVIPKEVLALEGKMFFGLMGAKGDVVRTSTVLAYCISQGALTPTATPDPTPDIYARILAAIGAAKIKSATVSDDGDLVIETSDGSTYDAGNVKGDKPTKGIDYWTPEDQRELAEQAAELVEIPIATTEAVGTIKPSTDFDIAADGTLTIYKPIELSASVSPSTAEMGGMVDDVTVRWETNKQPITLTVDGESVPAADRSKTLTGLGITVNRSFAVVAADARMSVTKSPGLTFLRYVYGKVGSPDAAPTQAADCVKQADLAAFGANGADFKYAAGDVIWLLTTKQDAKIQTNVLGQWADVNTYGGDPVQFTQSNGVTATYYAYRTDVFRAAGAAKYRIV